MKLKTFDHSKNEFGHIDLDSKVWASEFNPILVSLYNRYTLLNRRNIISKTKNKSEVSGGGRKPWRQKGTGRARQGSIRSPQWRGGGIVFGPNGNQNYSVSMNKKEKKIALWSVFAKKASSDEILILENLSFNDYKTKYAFSLLKKLKAEKKKILLVISLEENKSSELNKSFNNLKNVSVVNSKRLDITKLISSNLILITKNSISEIKNPFSEKRGEGR